MNKAITAAILATTLCSSCATTNLCAWADTRVASPVDQHFRIVAMLTFIVPALVADAVLHPLQIAAGVYPYGNDLEPMDADQRHAEPFVAKNIKR